MTVELYLGDCLEVMKSLPDRSVDAVVTDPPYASGARMAAQVRGKDGMTRGEVRKSRPMPNDNMTTTGFVWMLREMGLEAVRVLKDGASLLSFIDWRQYPTLYGALESVNLRVQTMVVWDKEIMALGNGFRNQHELVIHAAKGVPSVFDRSVPNVLRVPRLAGSELHPSEKPVPLLVRLLATITDRGATVLDPFMGSGTTGVACVQTGRSFIGIEIDPGYFAIAQKRIAEVQLQMRLPLEIEA